MGVLKFLWNLIRNNLALKIFAILFAVILWSYVIAETNPLRLKTLDNMPVKIENMQALRDKGLTVSEDLSKLLAKVSVSLEVRQKELKYVSVDNVTVALDLSKVNSKGETELKLTCTPKYGTLLRINPSTVAITVDEYVKKPVPVEVRMTGTQNSAYFIGDPQVFPNILEIAGALQDVEKVVSALCTVDLNGVTKSINQSFNVALLGQDRQALSDGSFFEALPSVIVKIDVLPKKTLNINVLDSLVNVAKLKEGYEIVKATAEPQQLEVAGKPEALGGLDDLLLESIDVSGAFENTVFHVKPKSIEGVRLLGNTDIAVMVEIAQKQTEKKFENIRLTYINRPSGLRAVLEPDAVTLLIKGGAADIGAIDPDELQVFVDLKGLEKGTHSLPVKVGNVNNALSAVPSVDKVKVTLK